MITAPFVELYCKGVMGRANGLNPNVEVGQRSIMISPSGSLVNVLLCSQRPLS